jgi:hypothetical protein
MVHFPLPVSLRKEGLKEKRGESCGREKESGRGGGWGFE